jgi:hypothetical protein
MMLVSVVALALGVAGRAPLLVVPFGVEIEAEVKIGTV